MTSSKYANLLRIWCVFAYLDFPNTAVVTGL